MLSAEVRILEAFAETLLPPTEKLSETIYDVDLTRGVERQISCLEKNYQRFFRLTLWLFELGGIFYRGLPFSFLGRKSQERYLLRWKESSLYPLRLLFRFLETQCLIVYYAHPSVYRKLGFIPPSVRPRSTPPKLAPLPDHDVTVATDVCVIGSGAGGGVVAKELAEKGYKVVILEEGGYFGINDFGREASEITQKIYRNTGMQMTMGLPAIVVPTGRAVGGTTVVNSGTCFRLPDNTLTRWQREFGLTMLTPENLKPYFDRVEEEISVAPVTDDILGKNSELFKRGLEKLGGEGAPLRRNAPNCQGAGMCCFGCPNDAKQAIHLSYIPKAVAAGALLYTHCRVAEIVPEQMMGGEVVGHFRRNGKGVSKIRVQAKVVVVAAGTLVSPYLLRKNQIQIYNSHIGKHLTIHPASKALALFDEEVRGWVGVPQGYQYDGLASDGLMFEGAFTPPSYASVNLSLPPRDHKRVMERYSHLASFGFMMSDEGRGWIRWLPTGEPIIYYSITRREVGRLIRGLKFLSEVYLAAGAKEIFPGVRGVVITPETGLAPFDRQKWRRSDFELAAFHPLGTCRMGVDRETSVVNSYGELHDVENLFVVDGSIFPSPLGVNPQETIMAFATRSAEHIRQRLSCCVP